MRRVPQVIGSVKSPHTILEVPDYIDTLCPEYVPQVGDDLAKIMFEAGRRSVAIQVRAEWAKGGDA